jgi:exonuclease III
MQANPGRTNQLKIGFININGIRNKVDRVKEIMRMESLDILCMVETWLEEGDNAGIRPVVVDVRKDRREGMSRGNGGVMIMSKPGVKVKVEEYDQEKNWVMVSVGSTRIVAAYFPPSEEFPFKDGRVRC